MSTENGNEGAVGRATACEIVARHALAAAGVQHAEAALPHILPHIECTARGVVAKDGGTVDDVIKRCRSRPGLAVLFGQESGGGGPSVEGKKYSELKTMEEKIAFLDANYPG